MMYRESYAFFTHALQQRRFSRPVSSSSWILDGLASPGCWLVRSALIGRLVGGLMGRSCVRAGLDIWQGLSRFIGSPLRCVSSVRLVGFIHWHISPSLLLGSQICGFLLRWIYWSDWSDVVPTMGEYKLQMRLDVLYIRDTKKILQFVNVFKNKLCKP